MRFSDQVVLLTGAGRGIGRALATGFCGDGARVVGVGRGREALEETARLCEGGRMNALVADVSSPADVDRIVSETIREHGRIDVLINNAAIYPKGALIEGDGSDWSRAIEINLIGPALCCRKVLPGMLERGYGRIVNVSSFAGVSPMPGSSAYSVSKAGLMSLTKAIAGEIDRDRYPNVLVNDLIPGAVKTSMSEHGADPSSVYPKARFLVQLPAGAPTGRVFVNNALHHEDYGIKARLKRKIADVKARITGGPRY